MRAGWIAVLMAVTWAGSLSAQYPRLSCEDELRNLPPQPPSPYPVRPLSCDGANDIVTAAWNNCADKVRAFLGTGVDPDWRSEDGRTALVTAAQDGHADVAAILLDAGADPSAQYGRKSALCRGARSTEVTRLFLKRGLLNELDDSCAYLEDYARRGDADLLDELLAAGLDLEKLGQTGDTPLVTAFEHRNYPMIQALLGAGANPHATLRGFPDARLIEYADRIGTCLLIRHGVDPNEPDSKGVTPLMSAAEVANEWKVRLLLGSGADPDLQDASGRTALLRALTGPVQLQHSRIRAEEKEAVALILLKAGANPKLRDKYGQDARAYAEKYRHHKAALWLDEHR